ncbi:MAG: glycosyltransferase family 2 protein [Candidatus Yanofskybacteria bacterium]|nr:glycosyltransferase family 2 protein [Candidatus Yanofskybacteria bacterium]
MYLSVIIPAYNEEKNIEKTVRSVFSYLKDKNIEHEIIVVTDGSKDKTNDIIRSLTSEVPTLQLFDYEINRGKGYAVKQGMSKSSGDLRLFIDADNSTPINHLEIFLSYINEGFFVVIGSIAVAGHKVAAGSEPVWRRVAGKLGNLFIQIVAVPGIRDTQRGFKLFTAEAAEKIFPKLTIERWGFDVEVLALARKFGFKIKEVPVDWKNAPESRVGLKAYFQVLLETVKIRWNLISGKYEM